MNNVKFVVTLLLFSLWWLVLAVFTLDACNKLCKLLCGFFIIPFMFSSFLRQSKKFIFFFYFLALIYMIFLNYIDTISLFSQFAIYLKKESLMLFLCFIFWIFTMVLIWVDYNKSIKHRGG